jgi:C-terminal processing protease CtpA/Prc
MISYSLMAGAAAVLAASTVTAAALLDPQATAPVAPVAPVQPVATTPATPVPAAATPIPTPRPVPPPATAPAAQLREALAVSLAAQELADLDVDLDVDFDFDEFFDGIDEVIEQAVDAEAIARKVEAATRDVDVDAIVAKAMQSVEGVLGGTPRLGIGVRDVTADEAKQAGLDGIRGAWVTSIAPESAAAKAGLAEGDIVTRLDGQDVRSARHLTRVVGETPVGRTVTLEYLRGGTRAQVSVTLEASRARGMAFRGREPGAFNFRMGEPMVWTRASRVRLGIGVQDLTPQLAQYFGVADGVLVTQVNEGTPAARGGMKAGDVITKVQDTAVTRAADVTRALAGVDAGSTVTIEVSRDKATTSLSVTLDKTPTRGPVTIRPRARTAAD